MNTYSFYLHPEDHQPSGTFTMSRLSCNESCIYFTPIQKLKKYKIIKKPILIVLFVLKHIMLILT